MKKCVKCNVIYNQNEIFCKKCGSKLKNDTKKTFDILRYIFGSIFILGFFTSFSEGISLYPFFVLFTGITLLPCLYNFLRKKINKGNDKIWLGVQIVFPVLFVMLFGMFLPVDVKIVESTGSCQYIKQFDLEDGGVYFYCLDKVEVKQEDDSYLTLKDLYAEDPNVIDSLILKLEIKYEYLDNSVLYSDSYYSILKCSNSDYVIGNNNMTFKNGFCGLEKAPKIKYSTDTTTDSKNQNNSSENKTENNINDKNQNTNKSEDKTEYSNLKNITNSTLKKFFVSACEQSNIEVKQIKELKKVDDWNNGPRYTFSYKNHSFILYAFDNGSISSITIANQNLDKIYLDGYEALNVNDFLIDFDSINLMQVKAESLIKSVANHPETVKFKWATTGGYGKNYDIYTISGEFEAKNSFGVEKKSEFYIELTKSGNTFTAVYMVIDNKNYIGKESQIKEIVRKEIVNTEEKNNSSEIILKEGQKGKYGKEDLFDGEKYIRYYVPQGTYTVEALVKNSMFFIETKKIYKNSDGYDTSDIIKEVSLSNVGDKKTVTIPKNGCILLVINSQIKLIPKK